MKTQTTTTGAETSAAQTIWLILAQSGINQFCNCILGEGTTEKNAWEDAYGPEGKKARSRRVRVWAEHVTDQKYFDLREGVSQLPADTHDPVGWY